MKEEAPPRRGAMKSRRSRSFSGFLGRCPGISQGPRSRFWKAEDEEGEETEETEVAGSPEASEAPNLALPNQHLVPNAEPNLLKMIDKMTQILGQLTQAVSPGDNSRLHP
ncbi:hypothetical protein O181_040244 [Austropuccinia psidii MF-1]|uniref:Uncharacterized protein n=1 Tax=Austropuccinia psidii MF-1 TaxID=1389203 RepID=A0A9Q3HFB6_9BASI|nr:hypothetical protein [Austropuccinia psidii MF-1]